MSVEVLDRRALNRATLDRQLLLQRSALPVMSAIQHLVGLQAQNPLDPYLALWSRLADFDPVVVAQQIEQRSLVRIVVMRGTIHLVTAADAATLRPLTQSVLDAEIARHPEFAPHLVGVDLAPILIEARQALAERPMSGTQLRAVLARRFPDVHAGAAAYACRCKLPLVQAPPRGVWGRSGQVTSTPLDAWVGMPERPLQSIDDVVLRYLAAFGPATAADVSAWSRLSGMREVIDRLGGQLRRFTDERGRDLFDLPDAPRPGPDVEAPVRLLPEYDNALLSHADRSRFHRDDADKFGGAIGPYRGSVVVDGRVSGLWRTRFDKAAQRATAVVEHLPLSSEALQTVSVEADRAVRFWHSSAVDVELQLLPIV